MEENPSDESSKGFLSSVSFFFPNGFRVLVVDNDRTCLMVIEKMLSSCDYIVTACRSAMTALAILRERTGGFDIVITDVHMPEMDGFMLLERIGLEMDLPVIMLSSDIEQCVAMRALEHGACFYMTKPAAMDDLKNIWQFAVRRKKRRFEIEPIIGSLQEDHVTSNKEIEPIIGSLQEDHVTSNKENDNGNDGNMEVKRQEDGQCESSVHDEENLKGKKKKKTKKRKNEEEEGDDSETEDGGSRTKKDRVVWHAGLHNQFLAAVNVLGLEKAVPKKILEIMNVPGLTRENVASHLQKYRMFLRRMSDENEIRPIPGPFYLGATKSVFARSFQAMTTPTTPTTSLSLMVFPSHTPQAESYNFGSGRFKTSSMNPQGNLQSMLLGTGTNFQQNLSQSFQRLEPNYMNSASIPSRGLSNAQMLNQQKQVGGGVLETGPYANFTTSNLQHWKDHPSMGGEASPPQTSVQISTYPKSYTEFQQSSRGAFSKIVRPQRQGGEVPRSANTSFNFFSDMNTVEMAIGTQTSKGPESTNFGSFLAAADGSNMMTTFNPIIGTNEEYQNKYMSGMVQQQEQVLVGGDGEEILRWSNSDPTATIPTQFSDPDLDDLVFK